MDTERERDEAGLLYSTHSLWPWLMHPNRIERFTNIEYNKFEAQHIVPNCATANLNGIKCLY